MDKRLTLPGEPGFAGFYPGSIVMISAIDKANLVWEHAPTLR